MEKAHPTVELLGTIQYRLLIAVLHYLALTVIGTVSEVTHMRELPWVAARWPKHFGQTLGGKEVEVGGYGKHRGIVSEWSLQLIVTSCPLTLVLRRHVRTEIALI